METLLINELIEGKIYTVTSILNITTFVQYLGAGDVKLNDGTKSFLIDTDVVKETKFPELFFKPFYWN